ncbi:molybdenum ABC transporter ATP-binding protein [Rhodocyclus tenuis]|uniref:Molybdate transport system ATP-binding protein n=1 Tax=Rhodocyclus tenuis TaxID=1066 RepID=A0A840G7B5_RHOTE|nr:molybdenum ABC transporter ATP-binding protein [Rhodocyclus tenuis]MBB4248243.1 molybdate transport system ATP-binding protein [Rhodocyclus tenuis]
MDSIDFRFRLDWPGFSLDVDLALPGRGVSGLFGHSGSGKTTLLRCIAGLERAAHGYLSVKGDVWQDDGHWRPVHRRPIGYVFQEASLFPHLDVIGNLRFGMKRVKTLSAGKAALETHLERAIELLGIEHLLKRKPGHLSGGERQRVGIARALALDPQLLLMDEPLAALDLKRKLEILPYLERLHDELAVPILYVSHAPDEVARLADHLVLLENGRVVASGPLTETLARADLPAAFADDAGVVIETVLAAHEEDGLSRLEFPGGQMYVGRRADPLGRRLRCRIHASDVSLTLNLPPDSSILNRLPVTVSDIVESDRLGHVIVRLEISGGGGALLARITERSRRLLDIKPGRQVWAQIKAVAVLA